MAKLLARSRSFRLRSERDDSFKINGDQGISYPVLISSDARPRDDLDAMRRKPNTLREHILQRPQTADSHRRSTENGTSSTQQQVVYSHPRRESSSAPPTKHSKPPYDRNLTFPTPAHSQIIYDAGPTEEIFIGLALGSPSQNPLPPLPMEARETGRTFSPGPPGAYASIPHSIDGMINDEDAAKHKGRWKMFGGLFGKKMSSSPVTPDSPFYQLQHTPPGMPHQYATTLKPKALSAREEEAQKPQRSPSKLTLARENTKKKLLSKKYAKEGGRPPLQSALSAPLFRSERRSPTPPSKEFPTINKPMLLQVDIPDVAMERYSVMFGNVLQQKPPSLMVRRQAQLEQLKTVGDQGPTMEEPYRQREPSRSGRRATSPLPMTKSPSFTLFPVLPAASRRGLSPQPPHKSSPLHRSATTPGAHSPARSNFDFPGPMVQDRSHVVVVNSPSHSSDTLSSSNGPKWSSDLSPTSTEASPVDESMQDQLHHGNAFGIKMTGTPPTQHSFPVPRSKFSSIPPPQPSQRILPLDIHHRVEKSPNPQTTPRSFMDQDMQSPPPIFSTPSYHSSRTASPKPQASTPRTRQSNDDLRSRDTHESSQISQRPRNPHIVNPLCSSPPSAAEISIARQISVSRRQRQLPVDIVPKTVRQPMQATLVSIEGHPDMQAADDGRKTGHMYRKSSHVLLEHA